MKQVYLLDDSLSVEVYYAPEDCDLEDNICLKICESCTEDEKIFIHDESQLFLTREQAQAIADALLTAIKKSSTKSK